MTTLACIVALLQAVGGFIVLANGAFPAACLWFMGAIYAALFAASNERVKELERTLAKRFSRGAILPKAKEG